MIYVNRRRKDQNGRFIRPSKVWFTKAKEKTKSAKTEKTQHKWDGKVYADPKEVKPALEELFYYKCAYCERNLPGEWDVEHFRPKGRVAERESHPGYYWLGYEWENLYPSCKLCNQRRKDKPMWSDPRELPASGKLDQFPLLDETTRAMSHKDDIYQEHTLLIDPCYDDPKWYFFYDTEGQVFSLKENPYGQKSIEVFNLNRRRLCKRRRKKVKRVIRMIELIREWEASGQEDAVADFKDLLRDLMKDESEYAGAVRFIEANLESL